MTKIFDHFENGKGQAALNHKSLRVYLWTDYRSHRFLNHRWFLVGNKHGDREKELNKKSAQCR
jgi:hypothetical protein